MTAGASFSLLLSAEDTNVKALDRKSCKLSSSSAINSALDMGYSPYFKCLPLLPAKKGKECAPSSPSIYDSAVYGELSSVSAVQNKNTVVRIVLASKMVVLYDTAVSARSVMEKYPGLYLARPNVFSQPHDSLVGSKEILRPGQKFYLVPKTTIKKLQQRHPRRSMKASDEAVVKVVASNKEKDEQEETPSSAKIFYASNREGTRCFASKSMQGSSRKEEKKKPSVLPVNRTRSLDRWQPTLPSVEEFSP